MKGIVRRKGYNYS